MAAQPDRALRILHVLRAPVGGLFRHVADLARHQAARGHLVGIVADSRTGGASAERRLAELAPHLALGVMRLPMSRHIDPSDNAVIAKVAQRAHQQAVDVLHGHGAKGGAYARLAHVEGAIRVYTPHGGSLHYGWLSPVGFLYLAAERLLMARTDLVLCESRYAQATLRAKVGTARALCRVVHNGLTRAEFAAAAPAPDATDLLFVGELRTLKGLDVLIAALARIARQGRQASATIVGEGPDRDALHAQVRESKLDAAIQFTGALPAREAFARGRLLVVPSRAESLPYIVLEAAAAGVPMIATDVGGIPEIFGADAANLVPPGDADALACAILAAWAEPARVRALTERLRQRVATHFSADAMTDAVLAAYRDAIAARQGLTNDESRRAPIVPEQGLGSATLPDIAPEQVGISPPQPSFEAPRATLTRPPASE